MRSHTPVGGLGALSPRPQTSLRADRTRVGLTFRTFRRGLRRSLAHRRSLYALAHSYRGPSPPQTNSGYHSDITVTAVVQKETLSSHAVNDGGFIILFYMARTDEDLRHGGGACGSSRAQQAQGCGPMQGCAYQDARGDRRASARQACAHARVGGLRDGAGRRDLLLAAAAA